METLRSYLETMFRHLPDQPEVNRAKRELGQMMEDKYAELIAQGASENEAVGAVISEFGNLDELAEELGLHTYAAESGTGYREGTSTGHADGDRAMSAGAGSGSERKDYGSPKDAGMGPANGYPSRRRVVSLDEADDYLCAKAIRAFFLALGVALCILAPAVSSYADGGVWEVLGDVWLFLSEAVGVSCIIVSGQRMKVWDFLDHEPFALEAETADYVAQLRRQYQGRHALMLAGGISCCILSVVPEMVFSELNLKSSRMILTRGDLGSFLLFVLVAVGVFLIVRSTSILNGYDKLLVPGDSDGGKRKTRRRRGRG